MITSTKSEKNKKYLSFVSCAVRSQAYCYILPLSKYMYLMSKTLIIVFSPQMNEEIHVELVLQTVIK